MRTLLALFTFSTICITAGAQPGKESALFYVNKKPVPVNEFIYLYQKNHKGRPGEFTQEKVDEYLDLYIKFKLKVEEARQRGMDTTAKFTKEFLGYKEALRKPYLPDNSLVDSLTRLTYERLRVEVKASHILVRVAADALPADTLAAYNKIVDIKKRSDAGEDFATLAVSLSEDPSAKTNEGSLGYFTAMQMVYPFESGAYSTTVGKVSAPIRTRFGYHLIKVVDKRAAVGEVEVSHILIRSGKDRDSEKARTQIFDVYNQLQRGGKWDELCNQFSEDQSTKENGGKLRPFGIGAMASVPEFEKTAFSLVQPGDYSAPFASQYGWHIVKLEKKIPLPPFNELEASLKSRVGRDERMQAAKATIQKNLRTKYKFSENAEAKKQALAKADSSLTKAAWKKPAVERDASAIFSIKGKETSIQQFFTYAESNQKANKIAPAIYFGQLYEAFVDASIQQAVEEELIASNADYRYLSNEYYEGILLFDIMEKEVWNRASEDTVGQANYFAANTDKYAAGERAQAVIYSGKLAALDELQKKIALDSLTDEWLKKNAVRVERGKFEKHERAPLSNIVWAAGTTRTEVEGNGYLVKIDRILPAGPRTLEEARGLIISDYQNYLEAEWVRGLRAKYPVKVNSKAKKYVLAKLVATKG